MDTTQVLNFIAYVLGKLGGTVGLLVLGLAAAWLLLAALKKNEYPWQYMLGIYVIFFLFAATIMWRQTSILAGAYALGNGLGLLLWGRSKSTKVEQPEEPNQTEP